jgi:hypothetical protein
VHTGKRDLTPEDHRIFDKLMEYCQRCIKKEISLL